MENVWALLIAVVVAVPPTLTILLTHFANKKDRGEKKKETDIRLEQIHVAVNSNMAAAEARIKEGNDQLTAARSEIAKMQEAALVRIETAAQLKIAELQSVGPASRRRT